jgi:hypothetical protein
VGQRDIKASARPRQTSSAVAAVSIAISVDISTMRSCGSDPKLGTRQASPQNAGAETTVIGRTERPSKHREPAQIPAAPSNTIALAMLATQLVTSACEPISCPNALSR